MKRFRHYRCKYGDQCDFSHDIAPYWLIVRLSSKDSSIMPSCNTIRCLMQVHNLSHSFTDSDCYLIHTDWLAADLQMMWSWEFQVHRNPHVWGHMKMQGSLIFTYYVIGYPESIINKSIHRRDKQFKYKWARVVTKTNECKCEIRLCELDLTSRSMIVAPWNSEQRAHASWRKWIEWMKTVATKDK